MVLSVVPEDGYVCLQIPIFGMLFKIVAEPGDQGTFETLDLTNGLRVVRGCERVLDPQKSR